MITRKTKGKIFYDNFNRADIGSNFSNNGSDVWDIYGSIHLRCVGSTDDARIWINSLPDMLDNFVVETHLMNPSGTSYSGLLFRHNETTNKHMEYYIASGYTNVYTNGTPGLLSNTGAGVSTGWGHGTWRRLKVSIQSGTFYGYVDNVLNITLANINNYNYTPNKVGLRMGTASNITTYFDYISVYKSTSVSCSGLPTGYKIRVGGLTATESGGTATLDCSTLSFPQSQIEVLNALDVVVSTSLFTDDLWGGDEFQFVFSKSIKCRLEKDANTVGLWHFNDVPPVPVQDYCGSNNGTISGATWVGNELKFNNATNNYVSIPDSDTYTFTNNIMTLECMAKFNSLKTTQWLISKGNTGSFEYAVSLTTVSGQVGIQFCTWPLNGSTNYTQTEAQYTFNLGQYYRISAVANGTTAYLYVDGVLVKESPITGYMANGSANVYIGNRQDLVSNSTFNPDCYIKDVRIWNTIRTQQQIDNNKNATLTGTETGLIGYWKLTEGTAATRYTKDYSGYGTAADGTVVNSSKCVPGGLGKGLRFYGTNQYVDCGTPTKLQFGTNPFTVELIMSTTTLGPASNHEATIIRYDLESGSPRRFFGFAYDNWWDSSDARGKIRWVVYDVNNGASYAIVPTTLYNDGKIHYFAGVRDGTALRLYADGILIGQTTIPAALNVNPPTNAPLYFGTAKITDTAMYYTGDIHQVRMSNVARSAQEIAHNWNRIAQVIQS